MKSNDSLLRLSRGRIVQAYRGAKRSVRGDSRFFVHCFSAAAVCIAAFTLEATLVDCAILLLCTTALFAAEMFHAALVRLSNSLLGPHHRTAREVVEASQAATTIVIVGAGLVSIIILVHRWQTVLAG